MPRLHPLESDLAHAWPPPNWQDITVLLAVSGGPDSVALFRAMLALKVERAGRLCVAHLNHQLRGKESAADEAFVVELCHQFGVPCHVKRAAVGQMAANSGEGIEAASRNARYSFFRRTAERLGARYLVTAHTADDQAETILHRIIRGTGIAGLAGMSRTRPLGPAVTLIRPLLTIRRRHLLDYLDQLGQPYRRDSSNASLSFTRNRIRRRLLPELAASFNPGVVDALLRLGVLAGEVQAVVDGLVADLAQRCVDCVDPGTVRIDLAKLRGQPRYLVREVFVAAWREMSWPLRAMGFIEWDRLAEIALASLEGCPSLSRERTFPGNVQADVDSGSVWLRRRPTMR